jgi:hypothetical protein
MTSTPSANAQAGSGPAALAADGPAADRADKLMLFGQFVGDWDVEFTVHNPDGTRQTERAEWHFGWVLEGRAVQDVWIVPRRSERDKASAIKSDYGTTIRFYDPAIDAWRVVYASPMHGDLLMFVARQVGDEIVLEGRAPTARRCAGYSRRSETIPSAGGASSLWTAGRPGNFTRRCLSAGPSRHSSFDVRVDRVP